MNSTTKAGLFLLFLLLVYIAAGMFNLRLDFTSDKRYTLSEGTKEVLVGLEDPLTVKAYFSEGLNAEFENHRREVLNLLQEYRELAGGNVEIEVINPSESEELANSAQEAGIPPFQTGSQGRDKLELQVAYFGMVLEYADQKEVIQVLQPNQPIEYPITKAIKKIAFPNKPVVGLLSGYGSPSIKSIPQANQEVLINYQLQEVSLNSDSTSIPLANCAVLAVINPTDSMSAADIKAIDSYYENGGKVFVAYSKAALNQGGQGMPTIEARNHALETWLSQKGIGFESNVITDAMAGEIMIPQGFFQIPMRFHYFPISERFAQHPITADLKGMIFQFIAPVNYSGQGVFTPLILSSQQSGKEPLPVYINLDRQWTEGDFKENGLVMAAALEEGEKRLVVVGNGDFFLNGEGQQQQQINPDNVNFFVNSLDWLAGNTSLVELRGKGYTSVPIKKLEESQVRLYRYANFLLPILLLLGYRVMRYQAASRKRNKWKEMVL
jgi:gliding-associated putative ABC transporter substrate-binding component GldG